MLNVNEIINLDYISGLLYVGDPHLSSRKPGTRNDENFTQTILDKLSLVVQIANDNNAVIIILGDLFDRENDADGKTGRLLLTRLIKILKLAKYPVFVLTGNHDKSENDLTEDTTLAALHEAGVIVAITESGIFLTGSIENSGLHFPFALGGTPHGQSIPLDIREDLSKLPNVPEISAWITHEDMAFDGAYPGSIELSEIIGCNIVVNGHMHLTKQPIQEGMTKWCNPGNITRQSKDCVDHVPSVWLMTGSPELEQIPLKFRHHIFSSLLSIVDEEKEGAIEVSSVPLESAFVEMLKLSQDIKTEDGSLLMQDIQECCERLKTSEDAQKMLLNIHIEALA